MQSVSQPLLCLPIVTLCEGGRKGQISKGWDVSRVHVFSGVPEIPGIFLFCIAAGFVLPICNPVQPGLGCEEEQDHSNCAAGSFNLSVDNREFQ